MAIKQDKSPPKTFEELGLELISRKHIGTRYEAYLDFRRACVARRYMNPNEAPFQTDLANELNTSQGIISGDLKYIRKQWRASAVRDWDNERQIRLDQIEAIKLEAKEAWEKSKEPAETNIEETSNKGLREVKKIKGQTGNVAYLNTMLQCIDREVELLELLDKEISIKIKTPQDRLLELIAEGKVTFSDLVQELGEDTAVGLTQQAKRLQAINNMV
jgi:hypothetical protein